MLSFMQNLFSPKGNPIGVDFGTDCLRLAQVQAVDGEDRLVAAASADVPSHLRRDWTQRLAWFVEATRDLLSQGRFRGRQAVLALPAASLHIQHLRMPKMDDEAMKKALPWEVRGKLPIDPAHALLRHMIAGEVYQDQEQKNEVIVLAAAREMVNQLLAAAAKARLDIVGMNVEPQVLADCFCHIYRRKTDADVTNCFVDIGCAGTRAIIARGRHVLFARSIPIGGDKFTQAAAEALQVNFEDAKLLRIKLCHVNPALDEHRERQTIATGDGDDKVTRRQGDKVTTAEGAGLSEAFLIPHLPASPADSGGGGVAVMEAPARKAVEARVESEEGEDRPTPQMQQQAQAVEEACREPLNKLIEELDLCRRYYEATFPSRPVDRLIFVGGEARQRSLCQQVARQMSLAAQVGDPLVRMGRQSEVSIESGIDRRQPQPGWAVAVGLSMGPAEGKT